MKSKHEIIEKRNTLEENLKRIKTECGQITIRHIIAELNWVLDNEKSRTKVSGVGKHKEGKRKTRNG